MPRTALLALALLAPVGCVSPPPVGPFVEYRDGQTPTTRTVKCEADYALVAHDPSAAVGPFGRHHVGRGGVLGFRRAADGSLTAVAPGYAVALPHGAYSWEVVPDSVAPLRERQWSVARAHLGTVAKAAGMTFLVGCTTLLVLIIAL
jgi:hypothetical protein